MKKYLSILMIAVLAVFAACSDDNDKTVYAVTFETDGGTPVPSVQRVEEGSMVSAPSANPTKSGYTFVFWHLNGATTAYNFQTPVSGDITLYAKWQEEATAEYRQVKWNLNGGEWPISGDNHITQVPKGGMLAEPAAPIKAGSTFDGWYEESDLINKIIFPYDVSAVTTNITLYAKWKIEGDGKPATNTITFKIAFGGEWRYLYLAGSGKATIDWGDGSSKETVVLKVLPYNNVMNSDYNIWHTYATPDLKTVTIAGDITGISITQGIRTIETGEMPGLKYLSCPNAGSLNQISKLDVSKNIALRQLNCSSNKLTSLDVSNCTLLTDLNCSSNNLTSLTLGSHPGLTRIECHINKLEKAELLAIFNALPTRVVTDYAKITCGAGNPGYSQLSDVDTKIARDKGWEVWGSGSWF